MRVAKRLTEQKGVLQAAALMGTEKNKSLLAEIGVAGKEISMATPNDLILAVKAENQQVIEEVLGNIDRWLQPPPDRAKTIPLRTLEEAIARLPQANLAVVSVPGQYAAREAQKALAHGLNVFLFSDHVPIEEEMSLKRYARDHGLIVMGPDCGTAIIGGIGIGFANAVRRGPIGVIGASGTGIQEFTTLVHRAGSGISHALGTGSRDLFAAIGGISFLSALEALESDHQTQVIAIIAKPPDPLVLANLRPRISRCPKPVVACFLGLPSKEFLAHVPGQIARTLDEAATLAVQLATGKTPPSFNIEPSALPVLIRRERAGMNPEQKYLRGIFAGGTFCYQAQQILKEAGILGYANAPLEGNKRLPDSHRSIEHTLIDMGADEFTAGRPHPMIDSRLRFERLLAEGQDPEVAVMLLDFILGFNAAPNPAGDLVPAIAGAKQEAQKRGGYLSVVASVCGTEEDPQNLKEQIKLLKETGAVVFPSSAQATQFCALLLASGKKRG